MSTLVAVVLEPGLGALLLVTALALMPVLTSGASGPGVGSFSIFSSCELFSWADDCCCDDVGLSDFFSQTLTFGGGASIKTVCTGSSISVDSALFGTFSASASKRAFWAFRKGKKETKFKWYAFYKFLNIGSQTAFSTGCFISYEWGFPNRHGLCQTW